MEARRGGDEWRVEVNLDDPEHGYRLGERLHALDLTPEAEDRLGNRVIVTRDGPRMFLYAGSEEQASEAERVARELLTHDDLSGTVQLTRWHPVEEAWKDPSVPLPQTEEEREAERTRHEEAEEREAEAEGEYDWELRVDLPSFRDAGELAKRLEDEGLDVTRRFRHLFVGVPTEERAAELQKRIEAETPEGTEIHLQLTEGIPHPLFVWLGAADPREP